MTLLVVGSGNYGGAPHETLTAFLNSLQPTNTGKAAVFATSGGPDPKCIPIMKEALEAKGYKSVSCFSCRGKLLFANRGHPDKEDLKNAKAFASDLKK